MSQQEIDGAIAAAGFDPQVERGLGRGPRETVLNVMVDRRITEEYPE
jgi:hypothetical protein